MSLAPVAMLDNHYLLVYPVLDNSLFLVYIICHLMNWITSDIHHNNMCLTSYQPPVQVENSNQFVVINKLGTVPIYKLGIIIVFEVRIISHFRIQDPKNPWFWF